MIYVRIFTLVATVLPVYGIETYHTFTPEMPIHIVATVLTVYGIETLFFANKF